MSKFLVEKYKNLEPYVPGEQPKDRAYVKLNTNESPFKPSKRGRRLAKKQLKKLMLYPDPEVKELLSAMAKAYNVSSKQIILTNGSDEVLNFAFMAYCDKDNPAIFPDITYGFYKVFAEINNLPYKEIPLKEDFTIDVNDYLTEKGSIFIANPNAPTGILLSLEQIEKILISNKDRVVVVDEAYIDFGGQSAISLINKYDNLLVTQTFSKSRSLAGARLGFGVASEKIIEDLVKIKYSTNPYNVNRTTASVGLGAVLDKKYFENNVKKIIENREFTENQLKDMGFSLTNSKANFIFAKNDKISGKDLYLKLKEKGILVRHFDKEKIKDYNRITIGNKREMKILLNAIKDILEEIK